MTANSDTAGAEKISQEFCIRLITARSVPPIPTQSTKKPLFTSSPARKRLSSPLWAAIPMRIPARTGNQPGRFERIIFDGQAISRGTDCYSAVAAAVKVSPNTYTEPTIFMELAAICGRLLNRTASKMSCQQRLYDTRSNRFRRDWLDAINVDLKAFSEDYYKRLCKARLQPVLRYN